MLECLSASHLNISMLILHTVLYAFPMVLKKENLFNNQELLKMMITTLILMTFAFGSAVRL